MKLASAAAAAFLIAGIAAGESLLPKDQFSTRRFSVTV